MERPAPDAPTEAEWFRVLFEAHLDSVWRFARRRCDSAEEADDVAADTFAVAWRRRADLPGGDEVRLWLVGTARFVLANRRRTAARLHRLHRRVEAVAPTAPAPPDPADVVAGRDRHLERALASLGEADRELLVMRAWDGLSVAEMASLLHVGPAVVSVRLTRARGRLEAALRAARDGRGATAGCGEPTYGGGER